MTPYEYCLTEQKIRQQYFKKEQELSNIPDWHPTKTLLIKEYHENEYTQIPSEKIANEYSEEHILNAVQKVRDYFGYTERDLLDHSF